MAAGTGQQTGGLSARLGRYRRLPVDEDDPCLRPKPQDVPGDAATEDAGAADGHVGFSGSRLPHLAAAHVPPTGVRRGSDGAVR